MKEETEVAKFNGSRMEVKNRKKIEWKEMYHPEYYVLRSGFYKIVRQTCLTGGSKSIWNFDLTSLWEIYLILFIYLFA